MKTNLKLIAIGIIILYCLTPLGAVEINTCDTKIDEQTIDATGAANAHNETKVVNNTDNTDAQTDVRDDVDTKTSVKDNARDSNSTIATKEVGKTAKDSNDDQSYMFDTDMEVYAEDTCAGSPIKVHCTAHNHQNPNDTRITGRISISANGTVLGYGEMINGKADIQLTHQLKSGNYILNAHYFTNDKYSPADATTTLTVKGEHANLNIKVNNVTPTGDATINITTNKEINNEFIPVKLDSSSNGYNVKITNGEGKLTVHNLKLGNHTVTANYQGSEKFYPDSASATFTVAKYDPDLNIEVNNVTTTGDATIDITTNKEINNESVAVKLDSSSNGYNVKITKGEGKLTVHNLKLGKHTVTANYQGNEKFTPESASRMFTVRADANLNIKVHDITPTGDATIDITTNKEINNGCVSVKLDSSSNVNVKITKGEGKLNVNNLKLGKHTVTANYPGCEKFYPDGASATFTVAKYNPNLNITFHNVTPTGDATIDITTNKEINNESVAVKLDSSSNGYNVKITKGEGKLNVHNLKLGKHTVTANYQGNEKFNPKSASATFTVGYDPDLNVEVNNVTPTGDATIDITTNKEINNESVAVKLDSSSNGYNVKITNGEGKLNVHNLELGKHTVTANYQGNEKFKPESASRMFTVRADANLKIEVHNVTADGDATIDITTNKKMDNESVVVKEYFLPSELNVKITNGEGKLNVHNLKLGKHTFIAEYGGNEKFKPDDAYTTITVAKYYSDLNIKVDNISVSDNATIDITTNKEIDNEFVSVKLNPTSSVYDVKITNGEGKLTVPNLKAGEYSVTANYKGSGKFYPKSASATFTVAKYNPDLNITFHNVTPTGDATIDITTNKKMDNEFIPVKLDSSSIAYKVRITNGEGKLNAHNQKLGKHTVTVNYPGNEKFLPDNASATFTVAKYDPNLNVEVNNVTPTGDATIDITTNKEIDNEIVAVKLDLSPKAYNVKITNGEGKLDVHNLSHGKHKVTANYQGNEKFNPKSASATFTVFDKYDPDLNIKVHDITPTGDATIDITTNKEIDNEFVSVKLYSISSVYDVKITNGEGKLNVHNLKLGKQPVTASYQGNEKFRSANAFETFTVAKYDANLNINVHDITPSGDATIDITTDKRIDDEFIAVGLYEPSSDPCLMKLKNGECRMYVHDLNPGKHEVIAVYVGNENFKFEYASTTFTVKSDLDPNLGVHFTNITEGQNPLAEITANKNLSGNVDAKLNTCNNPLAVSNSKLHSTTGNNTTTTVNPQTAGQYPYYKPRLLETETLMR